MPTMADLGKLATELYKGNPTVGAMGDSYSLQLDTSKVSSLGFTSSSFAVLSGEENDSSFAYYRSFGKTGTNGSSYGNRDNSYYQAVCLGD